MEQRSTNIRIYRYYLFKLVVMLISMWFVYQHIFCFYEKSADVTLLTVNSDARVASRLCTRLGTSRRRTFTTSRRPYSVAGTSSFQLHLKSGDIHPNPGPRKNRSSTPKHPCGECQQTVRNNQDAILCSECKTRLHAKCINMESLFSSITW